MKKAIVFIALSFLIVSCKNDESYKTFLSNPSLFSGTVHELNKVVMGNNFPPMIAARNYAYAAVAAYEVEAGGNPQQFNSLVGQLNGLAKLPKPDTTTPINYDLAALLSYIQVGEAVTFPEGSMKEYRDSILQIARKKGLPKDVEKASQAYADSVSKAIVAWSKNDNYLSFRGAEKYTVKNIPGRWVPTPPMYASAVEPHWGKIRPMALDSANQFPAPPPIPYNMTDKNSKYYQQVLAVKNVVDSLTPEQKHIAIFWDDNPFKMNVSGHIMFASKKFSPSGHWMGIIGIACKTANYDFKNTVYAYAKTSIAFFDAFIQCWYQKYKYAMARPETVINQSIDQTWTPYLQTPAFPEYTAGHSSISASAAESLTSIFGDNFKYTDSTELEFGIPNRSFSSFRAAAQENVYARFYGGIHFLPSCIEGNRLGTQVGSYVADKLKMKK